MKMYTHFFLFCVKLNYTGLQMSQGLHQNQIKASFLLGLITALTGMCFLAARNMLPEQQQVLHNRPFQTCV